MRRITCLLIAALAVPVLSGCAWDVKSSILQSLYGAFGEGYQGDRFSDFDSRYEKQSKLAEDYYREHE